MRVRAAVGCGARVVAVTSCIEWLLSSPLESLGDVESRNRRLETLMDSVCKCERG